MMCTNYVNRLVPDSNAEALSHKLKFKHANFGAHSTLGTTISCSQKKFKEQTQLQAWHQ